MNSNNKHDFMDVGGTIPGMGGVAHCEGEFIRPGRLKSPLHDAGAVADNCMAATAPGSLAAFLPAMEVRSRQAGIAMQSSIQPDIKMVRYRLDVGCKHQVTSEELKKVLIEESGVDKNNINIINIQGDYTLVELPDEMPQDIFLHLKSVEIKQHKLDIRRVKARNKKRGNNHGRRARQSRRMG